MYRIGDKQISLNVVDGPFGSQLKAEEYRENGVALIRVSNCRTGEILIDDDLVYISEEKHKQLIRSEVLPGDVLITKAGHILGYSAVFPEALQKGNITSHLAAIRPTKNVYSPFLSFFLSSSIGNRQIYRWGNKATRPELNTDEVREILIPLPPLPVQRKLMSEMERARHSRRRKLEQAHALLSGLDAFLLSRLGMTLTVSDHRLTYAMRLSGIRGSKQIGADYFHPERMNALRAIQTAKKVKRTARLENIADFLREPTYKYEPEQYLGLASVQSDTGELTETTGEPGSGQALIFKENDVLFARLRPYLNKVWRTERNGVCSTEFHVIRIKEDVNDLLPDYLAAVLRSSAIVAQTKHMMTGNTHPRLTNDDVVDLLIPIPDIRPQQEIVDELHVRRMEARHLREETVLEWEAAKARFVERLLSGEVAR